MKKLQTLVLALAAASLQACGDGGDPDGGATPTTDGPIVASTSEATPTFPALYEEIVATPTRDLSMLNLMLVLESTRRVMEPNIRDTSLYPDLADAAHAIVELTQDPVFQGYARRDDFERDPRSFERLRIELQRAAKGVEDAARAGDVESVWTHFSTIEASCVGCHKRYGPLH
ncbi:MAG: cytochrome c [Planctomycetota bacterium]